MPSFSPEQLINAYCNGIFPMADAEAGDAIYWYAPDPRAILPVEEFHLPTNLKRLVRQQPFTVATDRDFTAVMCGCADRTTTWISEEIIDVFTALHDLGYAHSVECWQGDTLVGGLYGVALQGAFFGESMFFRKSNASKVALTHLLDMLQRGGYVLHDIQFMTAHMKRFGAFELPRSEFMQRLEKALQVSATWQQPLPVPTIVAQGNS